MSGMIKSFKQEQSNAYNNHKNLKLLYQITKSPNNSKKPKNLKPLQMNYKNSVSISTDLNSPNSSINNCYDNSPLIKSAQYPQVSNTITTNTNISSENISKYKTEMCKNIELIGYCKWGDQCSFAHNRNELQSKGPYNYYYKTKVCKYYNDTGFCPYSFKCQFLHTKQYSAYNEILDCYEKKVSLRKISDKDLLEEMVEGTERVGQRLSVFKTIEEKNQVLNFHENCLENIFN